MRLASREKKLVIDLTHGTNPLVSAMLLSASMIRAVHGNKIIEGVYMAPVMGRPSKDTVVEFIDMTDAVKMVNTIASGINAWRSLDERMLPTQSINNIGNRLGPKYGTAYGELKKLTNKSKELLWALRSGQLPLIPSYLKDLSKLFSNVSETVGKLLSDEDAQREDITWIPIADVVIVSTNSLLGELNKNSNYETMLTAGRKLVKEGMPDRALGALRELVVAVLLAHHYGPGIYKVGGKEWEELERNMKCALTYESKKYLLEPLSWEHIQNYDSARQVRNKLMHGRITKEENIVVEITEVCDIEIKDPQK